MEATYSYNWSDPCVKRCMHTHTHTHIIRQTCITISIFSLYNYTSQPTHQIVSTEYQPILNLPFLIFAKDTSTNNLTGILVEPLKRDPSHNPSDSTGCMGRRREGGKRGEKEGREGRREEGIERREGGREGGKE